MSTQATPIPVIHDCDPGHDDAVSLLLALGSDAIDLRAVTTTFGNCPVQAATDNACRILTLAGDTDVPVAAGASGPLTGDDAVLGTYVHGASGLDGPPMPDSRITPRPQGAVALMRQVLADADEPVTIIATGPITNVARLLLDHPDSTDRIARIVFMGGSTDRGNHTPAAEFNTYADPEALDVVLRSGLPVQMVGLNLTHQALATPEVVDRMRAMDHDVGRTCAGWMGFFGASYHDLWDFAAPPVHDPCTTAWLIDPSLVGSQHAFVAVELQGRWTRGATVVDLHGRWPDEPANVEVGLTLDAARYWDLVLSAVDRLGKRADA